MNYNKDIITDTEEDVLVARMLRMVIDNDKMFTCLNDDIISQLVIEGLIEIDLENETIEGTTLTAKGWIRYNESNNYKKQ